MRGRRLLGITYLHRPHQKVRTLTCNDVASSDQVVMNSVILQVRSTMMMIVIWICVCPTLWSSGQPVDRNTARVKFTRSLAFSQCGCTGMSLVVAFAEFTSMQIPVRRAVNVSWSCRYIHKLDCK